MVKVEIALLVLCALSQATGCFQLITPSRWGAAPANCSAPLKDVLPENVVIIHTAGTPCHSKEECKRETKNVQDYHLGVKHWCDIGYNFLIGEDGNVYEGRGWRAEGAHTFGYNDLSLGIAFIGLFTEASQGQLMMSCAAIASRISSTTLHRVQFFEVGGVSTSSATPQRCSVTELDRSPNEAAWKALKCWLDFSVKIGYLHPDYLLMAHSDVSNLVSPGEHIRQVISKWPHYKHQ